MKSKKIGRLIDQVAENLAEMESCNFDRWQTLAVENANLLAEAKRTRNRNLWARERHAAMTDLGLVRVKSATGKVYYE